MTRFCFVWEKVSKSWVFLDLRKKYARKGDGQTKLAHFVRLEFSYFPASQAPRGTFSTLLSSLLDEEEISWRVEYDSELHYKQVGQG